MSVTLDNYINYEVKTQSNQIVTVCILIRHSKQVVALEKGNNHSLGYHGVFHRKVN